MKIKTTLALFVLLALPCACLGMMRHGPDGKPEVVLSDLDITAISHSELEGLSEQLRELIANLDKYLTEVDHLKGTQRYDAALMERDQAQAELNSVEDALSRKSPKTNLKTMSMYELLNARIEALGRVHSLDEGEGYDAAEAELKLVHDEMSGRSFKV